MCGGCGQDRSLRCMRLWEPINNQEKVNEPGEIERDSFD